MPVQDNETMLRDGSTSVSGAENGSWTLVGKGPYHNLALQIHLPTDGTQIVIDVEQADDSSGTNGESIPNSGFPITIAVGAETYVYPVQISRPYCRANVDSETGSFGAVQVGFIMAEKLDVAA